AETGIDKSAIRRLSQALGFPWWDKPAQPCLASRFPYGEGITSERLQRVGRAEAWLLNRGFSRVRVRSQGLAARIEVPADQLEKLFDLSRHEPLVSELLSLGFTSVSLDLEGLVSGKLNRAL
ncbi:MAG: TIGR00268 family protein, partial [Synechococcus sp.]|nr:TIGR00268 family protein [Synechococcus sp.]